MPDSRIAAPTEASVPCDTSALCGEEKKGGETDHMRGQCLGVCIRSMKGVSYEHPTTKRVSGTPGEQ